MIVDASAIVAMMLGESEADALADRLEQSPRRLTHPLSIYEAVAAITRVKRRSVLSAHQDVIEFLGVAGIELIAIEHPETIAAVEAFSRYGKGQAQPAQLNMGDCFSYACAQVRGMPLLHKGADFAGTDLG